MALENAPASQGSTGNWIINYVPTGSSAKSAAILGGGTSKSLTYSFTPDGFNRTINQETVEDPRLTMSQTLSQPGTTKETLEVKYVESTDAASANVLLTEGSTGQLTIRRGVPNSTAWATAQTVDIITYKAGAKRPDAPVANGVDTISQTLFITAATQMGVTTTA